MLKSLQLLLYFNSKSNPDIILRFNDKTNDTDCICASIYYVLLLTKEKPCLKVIFFAMSRPKNLSIDFSNHFCVCRDFTNGHFVRRVATTLGRTPP